MPVPPLTFFKAKKIDSIRYPYCIQTTQHPTTKVTNKQGYRQRQQNNKGEEQAKCYKQPRKRRQDKTPEKAADKRIRFGETTSPQGG